MLYLHNTDFTRLVLIKGIKQLLGERRLLEAEPYAKFAVAYFPIPIGIHFCELAWHRDWTRTHTPNQTSGASDTNQA